MSDENKEQQGQKGYKDQVYGKELEQRTPAPSLPKAPDPSPFSVGGGKK